MKCINILGNELKSFRHTSVHVILEVLKLNSKTTIYLLGINKIEDRYNIKAIHYI